jgi:hypothetical protein
MAVSKHRKNHKKKLNSRNLSIKDAKNRKNKYDLQLMERIQNELKNGSFDEKPDVVLGDKLSI